MSTIKKTSMFAALCLGLFVSSAHAQDSMTVKVSFPFLVNGEAFPAGEYDIRIADVAGATLLIQGRDHRPTGFVSTRPADGRDPVGDQPTLVFAQVGKEFRLTEVWASADSGRAIEETSTTSHDDSGHLNSSADALTRALTAH